MSHAPKRQATAALRRARQAWRLQYEDSAKSHALAEAALAKALATRDANAEGWARLTLGFDRYVLEPGDSVSFDCSTPHNYANHGSEPAIGIWFVAERYR